MLLLVLSLACWNSFLLLIPLFLFLLVFLMLVFSWSSLGQVLCDCWIICGGSRLLIRFWMGLSWRSIWNRLRMGIWIWIGIVVREVRIMTSLTSTEVFTFLCRYGTLGFLNRRLGIWGNFYHKIGLNWPCLQTSLVTTFDRKIAHWNYINFSSVCYQFSYEFE